MKQNGSPPFPLMEGSGDVTGGCWQRGSLKQAGVGIAFGSGWSSAAPSVIPYKPREVNHYCSAVANIIGHPQINGQEGSS